MKTITCKLPYCDYKNNDFLSHYQDCLYFTTFPSINNCLCSLVYKAMMYFIKNSGTGFILLNYKKIVIFYQ